MGSCSISFFLNSANLICPGMDISKYLIESLGIRDNESRLYKHMFSPKVVNSPALLFLDFQIQI